MLQRTLVLRPEVYLPGLQSRPVNLSRGVPIYHYLLYLLKLMRSCVDIAHMFAVL